MTDNRLLVLDWKSETLKMEISQQALVWQEVADNRVREVTDGQIRYEQKMDSQGTSWCQQERGRSGIQ